MSPPSWEETPPACARAPSSFEWTDAMPVTYLVRAPPPRSRNPRRNDNDLKDEIPFAALTTLDRLRESPPSPFPARGRWRPLREGGMWQSAR